MRPCRWLLAAGKDRRHAGAASRHGQAERTWTATTGGSGPGGHRPPFGGFATENSDADVGGGDAAGRGRPAPKWAAALVVVFALGSGEAAAQLTPDNTFDGNGLKVDVEAQVAESAGATITVTAKASVPGGTTSETPVTVTVDRRRGDSATTREALAVTPALAPADPAQASTLPPGAGPRRPAGRGDPRREAVGADDGPARGAGRRVRQRRPADAEPSDHRRGRLRGWLGREQLCPPCRGHDGKKGVGEAGRGGEADIDAASRRPRGPTG